MSLACSVDDISHQSLQSKLVKALSETAFETNLLPSERRAWTIWETIPVCSPKSAFHMTWTINMHIKLETFRVKFQQWMLIILHWKEAA